MDMTSVNVCATDDFKCVGALVYIDPENEECKTYVPEPALGPQHRRRPRHDALRADPGHR